MKVDTADLVISIRLLTPKLAIITVGKKDKSIIPICELIEITENN